MISMDFIIGLSMVMRQHDSIMVVVNNMSKEVHFILVKATPKASNIVKKFMKEIFVLHGLPNSIVLD